MARPAVPAMPTAEYSSAGNTFSISRLAIIEPMVARRSPAMTMPPSNASATIVVPCGAVHVTGRAGYPAAGAGRGWTGTPRTTTSRAS